MIGAAGHALLVAAMASAIATVAACVAAGITGRRGWLTAGRWGLVVTAGAVLLATGVLGWAMGSVDLRLAYVEHHVEHALPPVLRVAALWSGQEGSLLVWSAMIGTCAAGAALARRRVAGAGEWVTLGMLAVVNVFFAAMLVFAVQPFALATSPAEDGLGLHPQLQHWAMIVHPLLLLGGYAAFVVPFAIMCGALASRRAGPRPGGVEWAAGMRRWATGAWTCLGAGMALGAWWAYVELGWGGYWAWDPVENASLMPWLAGAALVHTIRVHERRGMLKRWTAGLAAGTFALCVLGAYVTRSGVVQSVHAYAASPVGHLLLGLLATVVAASAVIFVSGASGLVDSPPPDDQPRRTGSVNLARLANILLVTMAAATLVGTMFPVLSRLWSSTPVSLSPAYYHRTVAPLGVTTIGLMAVWPLACGLARDELRRRLRPALAVAALGVGACVWAGVREPVVLCCVVIAAVAVSTILIDLARSVLAHARQTGFGLGRSVVMVLDRAHGRLGSQIAHTGMALALIGLAGSSLLSRHGAMMLTPGGSATIGRPLQTVRLETINEVHGDNFTAAEAVLTLEGPDGSAVRLMPQRRYYDRFGEPTAEVAIRSTWRRDVYVAMTGWNGRDSRVALDVRINPLTLWIWIGAATVTLGGIVSLLPRVLPRPRVEATPWDDVRKGSNPSHEAPSSERASKP